MLRCDVRAEWPIERLADARSAFGFLRDCLPSSVYTTTWVRGETTSADIGVVAVGKSGYGKSTTLNALVGEQAFETSDTRGCTRNMQSVEYRFAATNAEHYFSFSDLPGIGERPDLDGQYLALYRKAMETANVVLYFVRADQRDYSVDQRAFGDLIDGSGVKDKVILVVNAIDKIEPLDRASPFSPSRAQLAALQHKIEMLSVLFGISASDIIPIAGSERFNLDALASAIARRVGPCMGASWQTMARMPASSLARVQAITKAMPASLLRLAKFTEKVGDPSLSATLAKIIFLEASLGLFELTHRPRGPVKSPDWKICP